MSKPIQMYTDATKSEKAYPRTLTSLVAHGDQTLNDVLEAQNENINNTARALEARIGESRAAVEEEIAQTQGQIANTSKHLGVYTRVSTLPLTANYATGKMLTTLADGKTVVLTDMPGWGVTRIFPLSEEHPEGFTFGDTAFLPMLSAQGENLMVDGATVFVSELIRTDDKGQVVYTELRKLYSASNNDVCEWGGLMRDIALRGRNLLVSHPLSVTLIDFGRSGRGASSATTEANLYDAMDEKANFAGRYPFLVTGQAIALEKTEAGVEDLAERLTARPVGFAPDLMHDFGSLDTRGAWDDADDLYLSVKKVTGDVVGGQQKMLNPSFKEGTIGYSPADGMTITMDGDVLLIKRGSAGAYSWCASEIPSIVKDHKYLSMATVNTDKIGGGLCSFFYYGNYAQVNFKEVEKWETHCAIVTASTSTGGATELARTSVEFDCNVRCKCVATLDLTTLFPTDPDFVTSLTEDDSLKVIHRLGIFAFEHDLPDDYPI